MITDLRLEILEKCEDSLGSNHMRVQFGDDSSNGAVFSGSAKRRESGTSLAMDRMNQLRYRTNDKVLSNTRSKRQLRPSTPWDWPLIRERWKSQSALDIGRDTTRVWQHGTEMVRKLRVLQNRRT